MGVFEGIGERILGGVTIAAEADDFVKSINHQRRLKPATNKGNGFNGKRRRFNHRHPSFNCKGLDVEKIMAVGGHL